MNAAFLLLAALAVVTVVADDDGVARHSGGRVAGEITDPCASLLGLPRGGDPLSAASRARRRAAGALGSLSLSRPLDRARRNGHAR
jgi:hypothetical protein